MRKINKGVPIACFVDMVTTNKPKNWDELHANHRAVYQDTRLSVCVDEQDCLCGYTELPINDVTNSHIDHYRKKSIFPHLTFEWSNFVVSVMDNDFGANYKDHNYCKCKDDYDKILNPMEDDCENCFAYTCLGQIEPRKGIEPAMMEKAENTITVFNLRHKALQRRRASILAQIEAYKGQLEKQDIISILSGNGFKSFIEYQLNNI